MSVAICFAETGGPDVLRLTDVDLRHPDAGEIMVHVQAAGVNPRDVKERSGIRPVSFDNGPARLGKDGAGVVAAVGDGVEGFGVGDPVAFTNASAAYASDVLVEARSAFLRPAGVTAAQGAAIGVPAGTAYQCLRSLGVGAGDTVLLHGGSGAVGQAAIQFARMFGATVIATCSPKRFDTVRRLGAEPVDYAANVVAEVRAIAEPTVIVDLAGTDEALEASFALLDDRARIATIVVGGKADALGIRAFSGGSPHPLTEQQLTWRTEAVAVTLALIAAGQFVVELGRTFPLSEAAAAHAELERGTHGKIVLIP